MLKEVDVKWTTAEWGFPKGRRNIKERDLECACREFEEESGFTSDDYQILDLKPVYEVYTGSDGQAYRHIYYVAQSNNKNPQLSSGNIHQATEISQIKWISYGDAQNLIRDYSVERKKSLRYLFNVLKNYIINSQ